LPLRRTDTSTTETFRDGADWLELRTQLSKSEQDLLTDLTSKYSLTGQQGTADAKVEINSNLFELNATMFDMLAVAWSLGDGKPTAGDYRTLDKESGAWVDEAMNEVRGLIVRRAEGNSPSPKKPKSSQTSSRSAPQSASTS
jgi:hypothetical protein